MSEPNGLADLQRLIDAETPDVIQAILAFSDRGEDYQAIRRQPDAMDFSSLKRALNQARYQRSKRLRIEKAHEVWRRYLAQDQSILAPQLQLADVVTKLYEDRTGPGRQVLLSLIEDAPLKFGLWGGLKRVYKRAEADLDAEVFGALAARFDREFTRRSAYGRDVSMGTLRYLTRRTWRFLRQLGKAVPELYPSFAVEVLRNYPENSYLRSMATGRHIEFHSAVKWGRDREADGKNFRAPYLSAWRRSPDPLMLLLETCRSDGAAQFAISGLRDLFPDSLRHLTPQWLARLCARPVGKAHELVIDTLENNPDYHSARLKELGLHDAVFSLLKSSSQRARTYAIAYARGHVASMPTERLVELLDDNVYERDVIQFAAGVLTGRSARDVGLPMVARLLKYNSSRQWAQEAFRKDFAPAEFTNDLLADLLLSDDYYLGQFIRDFVEKQIPKAQLGSGFWIGLLEDDRLSNALWDASDHFLERLGEYPVSSLPAEWVLESLSDDDLSYTVTDWLEQADALPAGLDAERIKGLVFDQATRQVAFSLLDNPKLISPDAVGVDWLLALARRADPSLHTWAHRYILQHVRAEHLGDGSAAAGVARMFALATGRKESEAARSLGQTWLLCHHPRLGAQQRIAQELSIQPGNPREVYSLELVWPTLWDDRSDVRRFGVTVARAELKRWGEPHRVYELAESSAREVRNVAYDALTQAGKANADPELALSLDDLDPAMVFSMTESTIRSTRDVAMNLIREHYQRLGGAERLGWLMQSADREVRMYAVRLLWEKHRPSRIPKGWAPQGGTPRGDSGTFDDDKALQNLLRRLLFAVPPARGGEKGGRRGGRRLPANAAKRRMVEVVCDFGLDDRAFAELVAPVLAEFTGSLAKGEWQSCLSALMTLRAAHGLLVEEMI